MHIATKFIFLSDAVNICTSKARLISSRNSWWQELVVSILETLANMTVLTSFAYSNAHLDAPVNDVVSHVEHQLNIDIILLAGTYRFGEVFSFFPPAEHCIHTTHAGHNHIGYVFVEGCRNLTQVIHVIGNSRWIHPTWRCLRWTLLPCRTYGSY